MILHPRYLATRPELPCNQVITLQLATLRCVVVRFHLDLTLSSASVSVARVASHRFYCCRSPTVQCFFCCWCTSQHTCACVCARLRVLFECTHSLHTPAQTCDYNQTVLSASHPNSPFFLAALLHCCSVIFWTEKLHAIQSTRLLFNHR